MTGAISLAAAIAERFHGHIQPNLISVLKAIYNFLLCCQEKFKA